MVDILREEIKINEAYRRGLAAGKHLEKKRIYRVLDEFDLVAIIPFELVLEKLEGKKKGAKFF